MTALFANRTPREKLLLAAMSGLVLIWLAVSQLWLPLLIHRHDITARIPRIERALAQVQIGTETLATQTLDPRPIPAIITEAAETFDLKISRLQPLNGQVQLTLEDAPFETVLLWIEALQRDDALHLVDLALTRRPAPGVVGTTLTLER
jgi:general secretion pathway protein M